MVSLTTLCLKGNQLEDVPDSFGLLKQLTEIDLSENNIKVVPDSILLAPLKKLILSKNGLQVLPAKLGTCKTLEKLVADNNKFTKLPDSLGQLPYLRELNIAFNGVRWLPETFSTLKNLTWLSLSDNPALTHIPDFTCFPELEVLKIRNIQIPKTDPSIQPLLKLQELDCRQNPHMGAIPDELGNLFRLPNLIYPTIN